RKDSSGLDLPIAVGLLASYGMVPETAVHSALFSPASYGNQRKRGRAAWLYDIMI
ncbi:hypothetical protein HMPREF1992_00317, partial [Selenomonas sp. oral taxon 892 str. F0426]